MKKILIKPSDVAKTVCNGEFVCSNNMILLPSTKDHLKEKGIRVIYNNLREENTSEKIECLDKKIERILRESFGVTEKVKVKKVISLIKGGM